MKTINTILLAAGMAALVGLGPVPARAETAAPAAAPVYAFVDVNRVMSQSEAGKSIHEEIEKRGQKVEAELQKENQALTAAAQEYKKAKEGMAANAPELAQKSKDLQAKYDAADRLLQNRKMTLNMGGTLSYKKLQEQAVDIIAKIMKEKGYSAVFSHEAVILAAKDLEITDEVIRRLNETVKKIPVDWAAASQAGQ